MIKITRDVLESYIACRYKAYLKLEGKVSATVQESKPVEINYSGHHMPLTFRDIIDPAWEILKSTTGRPRSTE
jgi:hypothetical protein